MRIVLEIDGRTTIEETEEVKRNEKVRREYARGTQRV